jgi:hypothetical protein
MGKATIHNVEVLHVMGATVQIQDCRGGIFAKPTGSTLMPYGLNGCGVARVNAKGNAVFRAINLFENAHPPFNQAIAGF